MNNNMLYEKNIKNIKNEIDFLERSTDSLKDEKIKVLKEQLNTFEQIIAKRNKIQKIKNEKKDASSNAEYLSKKAEIKDLYKEINSLKDKYHSKYGYKTILSSLFGQGNKRISNFVNKSSFVYRLRRANYNLRYDHPTVNAVLKFSLSGIILFISPSLVGAIPLVITSLNTATTFFKRTKGDFERKTPVLEGTYLDNIALSLYGYGKSKTILNTLISTMSNKKTSSKMDSSTDEKNVEKEEIKEEKTTIKEEKVEVGDKKDITDDSYDYYLKDLGLKEETKPVVEIKNNKEEDINYYLKELGFEVKDKRMNKDNWILKAKIKKVINKNTSEEYPEMTCLFYSDGKKVKQETFRLDSLTDNNDYVVIRNSLMSKYPFLKKEPDITISNAEKIIESSKSKSL